MKHERLQLYNINPNKCLDIQYTGVAFISEKLFSQTFHFQLVFHFRFCAFLEKYKDSNLVELQIKDRQDQVKLQVGYNLHKNKKKILHLNLKIFKEFYQRYVDMVH